MRQFWRTAGEGVATQTSGRKTLNAATYLSMQTMMQYRHDAKKLALAKQASIHSKQPSGHRTKLRGRGIDFDEVRRYQPGDDIRTMNWRVMAKTGHPYTKLFHDERERPVILWLDYSPSMFFATKQHFKSVVVSKIAALIAWSAYHHGDRVGGLMFGQSQHWEIRPRRQQNTVLRFLSMIDEAQQTLDWQGEASNIDSSLTRLRRITHSGSLIFLLSDFRTTTSLTETHLNRLARHNDVVLFNIYDPIEQTLPEGHFRVTDGQKQQLIDSYKTENRAKYEHDFKQHQNRLQALCWKEGMHYVPISTAQNILTTLQHCEVCSPFFNLK